MSQIFPESILRLIFDYSIQGPVALPPSIDDQRWVLTQVCQDWRDIIVDTPIYWKSFNFAPWKFQRKDIVRLAECFFGHSGETIPLSVSFGGSLQSEDGRNIFEFIIRPRAHRIHFFSCSITKETLKIVFGCDPVHFPILQAIDVAVMCDVSRFWTIVVASRTIHMPCRAELPPPLHNGVWVNQSRHPETWGCGDSAQFGEWLYYQRHWYWGWKYLLTDVKLQAIYFIYHFTSLPEEFPHLVFPYISPLVLLPRVNLVIFLASKIPNCWSSCVKSEMLYVLRDSKLISFGAKWEREWMS